MKINRAAILVLILAAALLLSGCAPVKDEQFQLVFGKSAAELIPSVGNAAYISRSLVEEEAPALAGSGDACSTEPEAVAAAAASAAADTYVDPTEGLDCSE